MRYSLSVILFLFLYASPLRAQVFEAGYVVTSAGDTIRGEVENAFWDEPPTAVRLRPTAGQAIVTYPTRRLRSIYLSSGRLLRQEVVPFDRSLYADIDHLPTRPVSHQRLDSVLVDVVVLGAATLLETSLHNVTHFFIRREQQPYLELAERKYLTVREGRTYIRDANNYRGYLLQYFGDCAAMGQLLDRTPFTTAGLQKIVQTYNRECSAAQQAGEEPGEVVADRRRGTVRAGLVGGVRYNSLRLVGEEPGPLHNQNADGRSHLQVGGYADLMSAGRRLAFHVALLASRFGRSGPVTLPAQTGGGRYEWNGTQVYAQFGLRGFVPFGANYQWLVGGGYEINTFWVDNSSFSYQGNDTEFLWSFNGTPLPYLETGISRQRLSLTVNGRYYERQGYSHFGPGRTYYDIRPWSLSLALSYQLNADADGKARRR